MEQNEHIERLKKQIDQILGTKSNLKRRKKTKEDVHKNIFLTTIPLLEHVIKRGIMLEIDYGFDTMKYDEAFYQIIDSFIYLHFEIESAELILFYLYDRVNPDGTINPVLDINGDEVILETVDDLWELIQQMEIEAKNNK